MTLKKGELRRVGRMAKILRSIDPPVIPAPPGRIVVERKQILPPRCEQPLSKLMGLDLFDLSCSIFW
jgi:hypothetical protein